MIKYKVEKQELDELIKKIKILDSKNIFNMIMCVIGTVIIIFSIAYYLMDTTLLTGCLSIFFIGGLVFMLYIISYNKSKKKIEKLKKEYKMLKEIYDLKEGEFDEFN